MIGRTISHYTIEEQLGEGGMGAVYLARDTLLDRRVAIKIVSPKATGNLAVVGRLLTEAKAASRLNHPNIVTVYEIARVDDLDFIAMECVEGRPLSQIIPPGGLSIAQALDYAGQIADALAAAHAANVIHRDIKPSNVMVTPSGRLKVLDFGLAKLTSPTKIDEAAQTRTFQAATAAGVVLGTVGYMSPEQIEGQPTDARSDVFSAGVLIYEILTGRRPFDGDSAWKIMEATVRSTAPSVGVLRADTPPELARIVARCLAPRPGDRYPSAAELASDLSRMSGGAPAARASHPWAIAAAGAVGILAAALLGWTACRESRLRWAREAAGVEIARLAAKDDLAGAYLVGRQAIAIAPDDSVVRQAWANLARERSITSDPPGAEIAFRGYSAENGAWVSLGQTPVQKAQVPLGLLRWRLTKAGYETLEVGQGLDLLEFHLTPAGASPPGMVLVPKGPIQLESASDQVVLPEYWLDRFEVTNKQFKAFVDAGGYRKPEYWKEPFVRDGRTLTWAAAMAELKDMTGRPGPSTWELGSYLEGRDDFPVGGVSFYEAAAYAAFAGKELPTVYHWYRASGAFSVFSGILGTSNFSSQGPRKIGGGGLGPYGTLDMAGNVKEWCWNATTGGRRYVPGGAFGEALYMFHDQDAQPPFDRRATFGIRLMLQKEPLAPKLLEAIRTLERDPASLKPVADEVYQAYRHLYDYDPLPLDTKIESAAAANPAWREERVSVRAAYGDERLPLRLFLPTSVKPPYQAIVYFPGSDAVGTPTSLSLNLLFVDFLVKSGRALVFPIYKGTYERRIRSGSRGPNAIRDLMVQRGKDLRRAVDYLETRDDVDRSKIAFYGLSLGAQFAPLFLAIEPRFRAGVLFSGGFETWNMPAESDPVNFAPHVKTPVLMVNGREDFDLPYATAQLPLFRALGTPEPDKRHVALEGGHLPSRPQEAFRVVLEWLDARLGPVN